MRGRLEEGLEQKAPEVSSVHLACHLYSSYITSLPRECFLEPLPGAYVLWLCRMPQDLLISFIQTNASCILFVLCRKNRMQQLFAMCVIMVLDLAASRWCPVL